MEHKYLEYQALFSLSFKIIDVHRAILALFRKCWDKAIFSMPKLKLILISNAGYRHLSKNSFTAGLFIDCDITCWLRFAPPPSQEVVRVTKSIISSKNNLMTFLQSLPFSRGGRLHLRIDNRQELNWILQHP